MKRRKYKTMYRVIGFPQPAYENECVVLSSWGICETEAIARDEIKRLIKAGKMDAQKRKPQNHPYVDAIKVRVA